MMETIENSTCTHVYHKSAIKIKCEFCPSGMKEDFSERGPNLETGAFNQDTDYHGERNLDENIDLEEKYFIQRSDSIGKFCMLKSRM